MKETYQYQTLNEVPKPWRTYKGVRLELDDINWMMTEANKDSEGFAMGLGKARLLFEKSHIVENGIWVKGKQDADKTKPIKII